MSAADILARAKAHKFKIIHIKGFASSLDFQPETLANCAYKSFLKEFHVNPDSHLVIVWDGDNYSDRSYTECIRRLITDHLPHVEFVAFKKKSEIPEFLVSWGKVCDTRKIKIFAVPDDLAWDELGVFGVNTTDAKSIVCFGGGDTLAKEYVLLANRGIVWKFYYITRTVNDKLQEPFFVKI